MDKITLFLQLVGALFVLAQLVRLSSFLHRYLRPSELPRYRREDTFALVTGATDGIGKAVANELASRGFHVILHGRNLGKLKAVQEQVRRYGTKVEIWFCDATTKDIDTSHLGKISLLVNNAAMTNEIATLQDNPVGKIEDTIRANTVFPTLLLRDLIPRLAKPALVVNLSSAAAFLPSPYLSVYAGTKAYDWAFSRCMSKELGQDDVVVQSVIIASVASAGNKSPISLVSPSSERFAKALCSSVSRDDTITPYFWHAVAFTFASAMPSFILDRKMRSGLEKAVKKS